MSLNEFLPLVANLATQNRDYAVFVGAGFSKDADLPTGWDILIDTLKPIYIMKHEKDTNPVVSYEAIEDWYKNDDDFNKMGYSEILEYSQSGEISRREYLKKYFENAKPGQAHRHLAEMVSQNLIKFIFTTNFDDLIEKSLDELSIDYDVIFSDEILEKTVSWDKVKKCRIYKLHGDFKIGKIKNTINELDKLDPLISEDFQYIIDRHGLIVIGYAGRDKGIMEHLIKRKPYTYPLYWQYRTFPSKCDETKLFFELKETYEKSGYEIKYIQNNEASKFLSEILNGIKKLNMYTIIQDSNSDFLDILSQSNEKQIHKFSLDIFNEFKTKYDGFIVKESKNNKFLFMFDIFSDLINSTQNIYKYFDALCEFNLVDEIISLLTKFLKLVNRENLFYA
ncbi:MAG: SIR2 family protein, partial [Candidatus Delongbacteria bacterium]|nr:SIR2 family protein [Candidatus Delongbacteria bacterium]